MNRYQVDGKIYAVIDGELWALVVPVSVIAQLPEREPKPKRKYQRRQKTVKKVTGSGKSRLDPALRESILADYRSGANTVNGLARRYKLGYATVYAICKYSGAARAKGNSGEPLKLFTHPQSYLCSNGHHFISKFPMTHARCNACHELAEAIDDESDVQEEVDA